MNLHNLYTYIKYNSSSIIMRDILNATTRKWRLGFNPGDCYNLSRSIAKYTLPRLKHFKKHTLSHPSELTDSDWDYQLGLMIKAFTILARDSDPKHWKGLDKREVFSMQLDEDFVIKTGLKAFAEHYKDLWS